MGNSEYNSIEDLVFSRSFRDWVLEKHSSDADYWENWLIRNPEKAEMVKHAKAVIYALHHNALSPTEDEVEVEVQKALQRLREAPRYFTAERPAKGRSRSMFYPLRARQVLALIVLFSGLCLAGYFFYRAEMRKHPDVFQSFLAGRHSSMLRQYLGPRLSDKAIILPDSSLVRLGTRSKLYYFPDLAGEGGSGAGREVFLDGEAFLDIRRNAARPFYVYTGQVVVRALPGTNFIIRAISSDPRITVTVRTGKVSVYRADDFYAHPAENGPGGVILTPNQQLVYDRAGVSWQVIFYPITPGF
jgi:transmembrane sensor